MEERFIYVIFGGSFWRYNIIHMVPRAYGDCDVCGRKMNIGDAHHLIIQERHEMYEGLKKEFGGEYYWSDFSPHNSWIGHKECLEVYIIGDEVPYDRRFDVKDNYG